METPNRDPQLWRMAKDRAKFKSHLFTYLAVNALLWAIWAFTNDYTGHHRHTQIPWPIFPMLFWGFGVTIQGLRTYGALSQPNLSEREYERLLRRQREGRI
ncbi:2TM domain-containing protein [Hymenobacter sp. BT186]|uniref:2TM domain-containing protein n=1 Tax=Hymenobacter telluris TaxID=2816474 RepID=A0A939J9Z3_9BACT|nr:2TM domain-containing protein [Hymenobacter telluris]MBO0357551.1 2TM domain-containing protein [Hymenobacter telluris]MBW3373577.1 2TM domain-containing protein [Hymenobacter norwichensis]